MKSSQSDFENVRKVGIDELFINFQPSQNLEIMKKFIKSKIDINETMDKQSSPNNESDSSRSPSSESRERPKDAAQPPTKAIHPPLPLEPPPKSPPVDLELNLKKEIEEVEEEDISLHTDPGDELITKFKTDKSEGSPEKRPTICRDFIRGTCIRPRKCRYAHKYDISQLVGVYTFCKNFQNSKCTYPICKYVHATVFQEQRFYRTGILPRNALAHHKKTSNVPPAAKDTNKVDIPINFSVPPPPLQTSVENTQNMTPEPTNKPKMPMLDSELGIKGTQHKSLQEDYNSFSFDIQREPQSDDKTIKKCAKCEIMEFRLQYHKERLEQIMKTSQEYSQKLKQVNRKHHKLYIVLFALLKQSAGRHLSPNLTNRPDKDKLLEQISNFVKSHRHPNLDDETNKFLGLPGI